MCDHCRNFPTMPPELPAGWVASLQSPFTCTEMTDHAGIPVNRAITTDDKPTVPVIRLCPECRTRHRMRLRPAQVKEARGWLVDCGLLSATGGLTDRTVLTMVHRAYDGGLTAFDRDTADL